MSGGAENSSASLGLEILARVPVAGGTLIRFKHDSVSTGTPMTAAVFIPPGVEYSSEIPALYWLSGLTCTDENFSQKAGAFPHAARERIALVIPDTSPRGAGIEGEDAAWDFGTGAGFYVDATVAPWARHYRMHTYVTQELPALVEREFRISPRLRSISGHSMGGHGALTIAFRDAGRSWVSVSAFAPICNPTESPWGQRAFRGYLGAPEAGAPHDAALLLRAHGPFPLLGEVLVDQGEGDQFLAQGQLRPEALEAAAAAVGQPLALRRRPGDHSYYFVASHIGDHVAFHAARLRERAAQRRVRAAAAAPAAAPGRNPARSPGDLPVRRRPPPRGHRANGGMTSSPGPGRRSLSD